MMSFAKMFEEKTSRILESSEKIKSVVETINKIKQKCNLKNLSETFAPQFKKLSNELTLSSNNSSKDLNSILIQLNNILDQLIEKIFAFFEIIVEYNQKYGSGMMEFMLQGLGSTITNLKDITKSSSPNNKKSGILNNPMVKEVFLSVFASSLDEPISSIVEKTFVKIQTMIEEYELKGKDMSKGIKKRISHTITSSSIFLSSMTIIESIVLKDIAFTTKNDPRYFSKLFKSLETKNMQSTFDLIKENVFCKFTIQNPKFSTVGKEFLDAGKKSIVKALQTIAENQNNNESMQNIKDRLIKLTKKFECYATGELINDEQNNSVPIDGVKDLFESPDDSSDTTIGGGSHNSHSRNFMSRKKKKNMGKAKAKAKARLSQNKRKQKQKQKQKTNWRTN